MRRVNPRFKENPFLNETTKDIVTGKKKIYSPVDSNKFMITNVATGEVIPAGIYCQKEVEKSEFVKLYAKGAAAIMGLKSAGIKVFQIMYGQLLGRDGKDKTEIILNYDILDEDIKKWISYRTFVRGIGELVKARFIAETYAAGYYFVNPAFIYNGNRLLIAEDYILKEDKTEKPVEVVQDYSEDDQIPLDFDD